MYIKGFPQRQPLHKKNDLEARSGALKAVSYGFYEVKTHVIPEILIFKNGFMGDIAFRSKEEIFPKSPLALF